MAKLLMITGLGSAEDIASGKKGAFYNTLEEFHKYWERIDIIVPRVKHPIKNIFGNVFIHVSPWPLIFHPVWFLKKGLEIYKEQKFDLMTVHEFPPFYNGIGARLLWNRIKVPYILEIMHIPGYPKSASLKELFYKILMRWFIKIDTAKALAIRVINKKETPEFLKANGISEKKLVYIPAFYIDLYIFKPMESKKEYDLVFVGRLAKNKGVNLFLEAVKKSKMRALIVGDGPLMKSLRFKIKNENLEGQVAFHGWAKDQVEIANLLNKSKILVMSSYNEGGPRVVLEAMACGVPVLATPVGIVPDVIKDKKSGRIIDWNAEDMAEKAIDLLNNSDEYQLFQKNGLEIVKQFEKESSIRNYADKIKSLLINR